MEITMGVQGLCTYTMAAVDDVGFERRCTLSRSVWCEKLS
jgi:hypothetical protein